MNVEIYCFTRIYLTTIVAIHQKWKNSNLIRYIETFHSLVRDDLKLPTWGLGGTQSECGGWRFETHLWNPHLAWWETSPWGKKSFMCVKKKKKKKTFRSLIFYLRLKDKSLYLFINIFLILVYNEIMYVFCFTAYYRYDIEFTSKNWNIFKFDNLLMKLINPIVRRLITKCQNDQKYFLAYW